MKAGAGRLSFTGEGLGGFSALELPPSPSREEGNGVGDFTANAASHSSTQARRFSDLAGAVSDFPVASL
jgi:hypothetical protein